MNRVTHFRNLALGIVEKIQWLPAVITRIIIGFVFIESGWGKLHNLEKVTEFFTSLGIPLARVQAPFVAATEFICGTLVFIGLGTRLASIPLMGTMVVAILTAKLSDIHELSDLFSTSEFLFIIMMGWLVIYGPSWLSVDRVLFAKTKKK